MNKPSTRIPFGSHERTAIDHRTRWLKDEVDYVRYLQERHNIVETLRNVANEANRMAAIIESGVGTL
jgi:hypothetical protein